MADNNVTGALFDIPNQNVSYDEKIKDDYKFCKLTINAIIGRSTFTTNQWKTWLKKLYDYYNGNINKEDYTLVTAPFGKELEGDWSDVENYPIIKTKIDLLRAEYNKRPKKDMVYVVNQDVVTKHTEERNKEINAALEQLFINAVNERVDTGIESKEVAPPERIVEQFEQSYLDKRAIIGNKALKYISSVQKLEEKFDLAFFHWLVTGEVYSYHTTEHNEPVEEIVNPLDIDYDKDPDIINIEDGDWVVRRKYMLPSSIIDLFYDELTPEEIKKIDTLAIQGPAMTASSSFIADRTDGFRNFSRIIEVMHVVWKSRKKIGIVDFIDEFGQPQSIEVDENYKTAENETVTWHWVNEGWEGYRIGTEMFKRMRPIPVQRGSLDNISKCKLPYNGRVLSNINSRSISLVSLGIPYQRLYNATFHRLKLAMAKMKDDMAMVDINWKPAQWTIDKWLEYADRVSMLFVDYSKDSVKMNSTHQTRLQLASQTINLYTELLRFIKEEWDEVCGITRQREGQVNTSETVGGVERSVLQSSLITEPYFTPFEQFRKREMEALLDYSKLAWINGKKASYVLPDSAQIVYLDIDPTEYCETEFGIAVSDSSKEQEKVNIIKQLAQPMMQNGIAASAIADVLESETISEAKVKLKVAERKLQEYEQFVAKQEQEAALALEDKRKENIQLEQEYALEQIDRKGEWRIKEVQLTALGIDDGGNTNDILEQAKLSLEERKFATEASLKDKELNIKNKTEHDKMLHEKQMKLEEAKLKREEMRSKEKIARSKPKPKAK